ncbi:MAG: hypothetical protein JXQ75_11220 [Phycisphaerae bacterium]|nr:hypothetical protein [Phycisphaerae bacterium]
MDPNNVLIRCPAGHELQAARTDLSKALRCPICNVTFTPSGGPAMQTGSAAHVGPESLGYAGTMRRPVFRPTYAGWLVGLWIAAEVLGTINSFAQMGGGIDPQTPDPIVMVGGCFIFLVIIPAIVLQLMWIYRIHDDARRARGYYAVSPGLALGLSFIPFFNYIWTGWTMKKLAEFAASEDRSQDPTTAEAVRPATLCFYFGIAKVVANVVGMAVGGAVGFKAAMEAVPGGPVDPFENVGTAFHVIVALVNLVSLAAVVVYAWTLPKFMTPLYRFLVAKD